MGGKMWGYDCYNLRQHGVLDIETFVDIGATAGDASIMAMILFPFARIVGIEPNKDSFAELNRFAGKRYHFYNIALGDGSPLYCKPSGREGQGKFIPNKPEYETYAVESKYLSQIFTDYNINTNGSFILKCDCEGGEKFLLEEWDKSLGIIRKAIQFNIEIHIGAWNKKEDWNKYLEALRETHNIYIGSFLYDGKKKIKYFYKQLNGSLSDYKGGWINIMAQKRFSKDIHTNDLYYNSLSPYWRWFCTEGKVWE